MIVVILVAMVYLPTLDLHPWGDDFEWLYASTNLIGNPATLLAPINGFIRPVVKMSYVCNAEFLTPSMWIFPATTVAIHLLALALLWRLLSALGWSSWDAAICTFLFGVSSAYSEVTLWAAGRPDSLLLVFMLVALTLVLERGRFSLRHHVALGLAVILAAGSKETWVVLPPLLLGFAWFGAGLSWRQCAVRTAIPFAGLVLYLMAVLGRSGSMGPPDYTRISLHDFAGKLTYSGLRPLGLESYSNGSLWVALLVATILLAGALLFLWTGDSVGIGGILWFVLTVAPTLIIPYSPSRYNYLPLIGFWMASCATFRLIRDRMGVWLRGGYAVWSIPAVIAVVSYSAVQSVWIQREASDYRRLGEASRVLLAGARKVVRTAPQRLPLVVFNAGKRRIVTEVSMTAQGLPKLLFVRENALLQLVYPAPLLTFAAAPHLGRYVAIDTATIGPSEPAFAVAFTDAGFGEPGPFDALKLANLDPRTKNRVFALRWENWH